MNYFEVNGTTTGVQTAPYTLAYFTAATNQSLFVTAAKVTARSDATNEQIRLVFQRISALGSPTATAVIPRPLGDQDNAAAFSAAIEVTAGEPTYASNTEINEDSGPSVTGWRYNPVVDERLEIRGGDSWGLRLLQAATDRDYTVVIIVAEVG